VCKIGLDGQSCSQKIFTADIVRKLSGKPTIAVGSITLGNDFKSAHGKEQAAPRN
jgi:hypothetical protein